MRRLQTQPNTDTRIGNLTRTFIVPYLQSLLCVFVAFKSSFSLHFPPPPLEGKSLCPLANFKGPLSPSVNFEELPFRQKFMGEQPCTHLLCVPFHSHPFRAFLVPLYSPPQPTPASLHAIPYLYLNPAEAAAGCFLLNEQGFFLFF